MKLNHLLILNFIFVCSTQATDMSSSYSKGQQHAGQAVGSVTDAVKSANGEMIPGFNKYMPQDAFIKEDSLSTQVFIENATNPGSEFLKDQSASRKTFHISPEKDPLFTTGNKAVADPKKTIEEDFEIKEETLTTSNTYETCEEGGDEYMQTCMDTLNVNVSVTPEKRTEERYCPHGGTHVIKKKSWCSGNHYISCSGCETKVNVTPKSVSVSEYWTDGCAHLDRMVDEGVCSYENIENGPPETRNINGESISRGSFYKRKTYKCLVPVKSNCESLRARGCVQISSQCKETRGGVCVVWTQTYQCQNTKRHIIVTRDGNKKLFCVGGDCQDTSYEPNTEFLEAISQLSVLREAQQDIRNAVSIFKGYDRRCSRNCVNFKDCCGNGKGWGVSLHVTQCSPDEKDLADQRKLRRCVCVGTYCSQRMMGICTSKKTTFCCFANKLSRIIQEQGRRQLGLGWGNPQNPSCEGLTPEQLSQIDLSQIDFSEFYEEILAKVKMKEPSDAGPVVERLKDNLKTLETRKSDPPGEKAVL